MKIPTLYSAKRIERQFYTGEEPVIVMCSDVNLYGFRMEKFHRMSN